GYFGRARPVASRPYTLTLVGFGLVGVLMGRLSDRFGPIVPIMLGIAGLAIGHALAGSAPGIWSFTLAHGLIVGTLGTAATFAPLVADAGLWFDRRRGIAR